MAKQVIGIGTLANDGTGDPLRVAVDKVNDNFTEVYNSVGELEALTSELSEDKAVQDVVLFTSMGGDVKALPVLFDYGKTTTNTPFVSGTVQLALVNIPIATTLTGVRFRYGDNEGNFTPSDFNGVGLYKVVGTNIERVALSADNPYAFLKFYDFPGNVGEYLFSSSYEAEPGLYYIALLCSYEAEPSVIPSVYTSTIPALVATDGFLGIDVPFSGGIAGQTSFASTYAVSGISDNNVPAIACLI